MALDLAQPSPTQPASSSLPPARRLLPSMRRLSALDWLYAALLIGGAAFALRLYANYMDVYEKVILAAAAATFIVLGWNWRAMRNLVVLVGALALFAISIYHGDLARADNAFLLKYFLSSQTAVLWMCTLFFAATTAYWVQLATPLGQSSAFSAQLGTGLTWGAVALGATGLAVRWYESYLIGADVGHIPISNLYEVFVLFCLITALFYLFYEQRYQTRSLGAFVLLVITAAVGFLLWYTFDREAQEIQPLVPALQSWWMKIHVPANFIGYGTFSLAAMVAFAYLVKRYQGAQPWWKLGAVALAGLLLIAEPLAFRKSGISIYWGVYFGIAAFIIAAVLTARARIAARLPALEVLDDVMYKSIAVGFGFFTVATILGALWAAEAWGSYWQWDPKETWALIVWLNYAAWLHMRMVKGLRGPMLAWWALTGLIVTTFAFLGVNIFLSGLHSYGTL